MTPDGLDHVFFTNSGSEANDTVVKIVWYYNNAIGRPEKKKFIARNGGYHGITVASGSLTGLPVEPEGLRPAARFRAARHLPASLPLRPDRARARRPSPTGSRAELEEVILEEGPETVAAFIGEPLMGAGGVLRAAGRLLGAQCRRSAAGTTS